MCWLMKIGPEVDLVAVHVEVLSISATLIGLYSSKSFVIGARRIAGSFGVLVC